MPRKKIIIKDHSKINKNEIVITPSYRDLSKLNKWNFLKYKYNLLVYEKIDGLEKEEKINDLHYKIPSYGEGTMAFFYHVIKNYHNLEDKIHYTKMHWIHEFSNPIIFLKDLEKKEEYYQHKTNRTFVNMHEDLRHMGGINAVKCLLEKNGKWKNQKIKLYNRNPHCHECTEKEKCLGCGHIMIEDDEFRDTFFEFSNLYKGCLPLDKLKEIFPKCSLKTELKKIYKDGSFSVTKELILKHNIEVYKDILENICKKNLMCRDSMILFLYMFFEETMKL